VELPHLRILFICHVAVLVFVGVGRSTADDVAERPAADGVAEASSTGDAADKSDAGASWRMDQRLCGVNATYMFLGLLGCDVEYEELKDSLPVDEGGTRILYMRDAVRQQGLNAKVVRMDFRQLAKISFPAIAHVEKDLPADFELSHRGHYIILLSINEMDGIRYIDGTSGRFGTQQPANFFRESSGYLLLVDSGVKFVPELLLSLACICIAVTSWSFYASRRAYRAAAECSDLPAESCPKQPEIPSSV
jgi:Peptidase C39 family